MPHLGLNGSELKQKFIQGNLHLVGGKKEETFKTVAMANEGAKSLDNRSKTVDLN
jgi:hypothetical protein